MANHMDPLVIRRGVDLAICLYVVRELSSSQPEYRPTIIVA